MNPWEGLCSDPQTLSDNDFTYDGTDYRIRFLDVQTSDQLLSIHFNTGLTAEAQTLVLDVDGTRFDFQSGGGGANFMRWNNSGLNWSAGDTVTLKLLANPALPTHSGISALSAGDRVQISFLGQVNDEVARLPPVSAFRVTAAGRPVTVDGVSASL